MANYITHTHTHTNIRMQIQDFISLIIFYAKDCVRKTNLNPLGVVTGNNLKVIYTTTSTSNKTYITLGDLPIVSS